MMKHRKRGWRGWPLTLGPLLVLSASAFAQNQHYEFSAPFAVRNASQFGSGAGAVTWEYQLRAPHVDVGDGFHLGGEGRKGWWIDGHASLKGDIAVKFQAYASAGSVTVKLPMRIFIDVDNMENIHVGQPVKIKTSMKLDGSPLFESTSPGAGVRLLVPLQASPRLELQAHAGWPIYKTADFGWHPSISGDYEIFDSTSLLNSQLVSKYGSYTWPNKMLPILTGKVHVPTIHIQKTQMNADGTIGGKGQDAVLTLEGNITNAVIFILQKLGLPVPPLSHTFKNVELLAHFIYADITISALQFKLQGEADLVQDIKVAFESPKLTLTFSNGQVISVKAGEDVTGITFPEGGLAFSVTADLPNQLINKSGFGFKETVNFSPFDLIFKPKAGFNTWLGFIGVDLGKYDFNPWQWKHDENQYLGKTWAFPLPLGQFSSSQNQIATQDYRVEQVGVLPNGIEEVAEGVNDSADLLATALNGRGYHGTVTDVTGKTRKVMAAEDARDVPTAISADDHVTGGFGAKVVPFLANPDATVESVPVPGAFDYAGGLAISPDGTAITGYIARTDQANGPEGRSLGGGGATVQAFRSANHQMTILPSDGKPLAWGRGINAAGVICGQVQSDAVIWDAQNRLTYLAYPQGGRLSSANAIENNSIVGDMLFYESWTAVRWENGKPGVLAPLPGDATSSAIALSGRYTVGRSVSASGESHAVVWLPNGSVRRLQAFVRPDADLLETAVGINSHGVIAVTGHDKIGHRHAYRLTPISPMSTR